MCAADPVVANVEQGTTNAGVRLIGGVSLCAAVTLGCRTRLSCCSGPAEVSLEVQTSHWVLAALGCNRLIHLVFACNHGVPRGTGPPTRPARDARPGAREARRRLRLDRRFHHHVPILVHVVKFASHDNGPLALAASVGDKSKEPR